MPSCLRVLPLVVASLLACSSDPAPSDAGLDAGFDAGPSSVAEAEVGPAGGTLALGPVRLEVPASAVAAPTTFRITEVSRAPGLPAGASAVSSLYRLEPAAAFAAPVRVRIAIDRAHVPAGGDGLLLLRAPTGTDAFQPIGAADPAAAEVIGETAEFSEILVVLLRMANCAAPPPSACSAVCDRSTASCAGECTLRAAGGDLTATCTAELAADRVSCTCASTDPARTPVITGPLQLSTVLGGSLGLTAWTFLTRCGWPCGAAPGDAGVPEPDAAPRDAEPDAAPRDAEPDAGEAPDAGEPVVPTIELVSSSPGLQGAQRLRVGGGFVSWARPTIPDLRAMSVTGEGEYEVAGPAEFPAEHFGRAGAVLVYGAMGIAEEAFRYVRLPGTSPMPRALEAPELPEPEQQTFTLDRQFFATDGNSVWLPGLVTDTFTQRAEYGLYQAPIAGGRLRGVMKGVTTSYVVNGNGVTLAIGNTRNELGEVDQCGLFIAGGGDAVAAVPRIRDPGCDLSSDRAAVAATTIFYKDDRGSSYRVIASAIGAGGGRDVHVNESQGSGYGDIVAGRTHVYWFGGEGMMRIAADGTGTAERVYWMPNVVYFAYDDGYLYWVTTRGATTVLERARVD